MSKLCPGDVRAIRTASLRDGVSRRELAERYGVTPELIRLVLIRKVHAGVRDEERLPAYRSAPALTPDEVRDVRRRYLTSEPMRAIARRIGRGAHHTSAIARGRAYRHVPLEAPVGRARRHRLTRADAVAIRRRYRKDPSSTTRAIAAEYGMTTAAVRHVLIGRTWAGLGKPLPPRPHAQVAARGEAHGRSKLTAAKVLRIRIEAARGTHHGIIARRHGVHGSTVSLIARGQRWAHVGGPLSERYIRHELSAADVRAIRRAAARGTAQAEIARRHGVGPTTIAHVVHGRTYREAALARER